MGTSTEHVMTIANSIIGVSVLAMPFCFKQCGIVLSILLLLISGLMTRLACYYLLKSAITTRRRNFEYLAFHAFGPSGKLFVELGIIGFLLGTCIAFFVVMGDLGPVIIGPALNIDSFATLRPSVLMGLALLVVLPLGLLKNVDSLSAVCAASIAFYLCLVLKVMAEATTHLISWDWVDKVNLWRPSGVPQCIPIFAMALSCQTQLFEIFDSVPNTPLEKMNAVIKSAINMCTAVYISVGFFGYIAFCTQNFSGNLLMSFSPTLASEVIKLGFVLSVAVSFPLVIFPCRASLHSLLFRRGHTPHHELLSGSGNYIPEPRFKCLTIFIVMFSLGTGLLIPSIEVVLGLVGSTIGIMICIMFPALTFICISHKNNNERLVAQGLFAVGFIIMILGTYTNLYATEEALSKPSVEIQKIAQPALKPPSNINNIPAEITNAFEDKQNSNDKLVKNIPAEIVVQEVKTAIPINIKKDFSVLQSVVEEKDSNKRKEPPVPVAPGDTVIKEEKDNNVPADPSTLTKIKESKINDKNYNSIIAQPNDSVVEIKKDETISNDAIKREEEEIKESKANVNVDVQKKKEDILEKLQKHEEEQKKLIEQQKALLEELKKQNQQQKEQNNILRQEDNNKNNIIDTVQDKVVDQKLLSYDTKMKIESPKEQSVKILNEIVANEKKNKLADSNADKILPRNDNVPSIERLAPAIPSSKDKNLTPIMANKMAKGMPLPLAIKENLVDAAKGVNESKKVDQVLNNKPMVRDILVDNKKIDKEEREKRDLDDVIKMDMTLNDVKQVSGNENVKSDRIISEKFMNDRKKETISNSFKEPMLNKQLEDKDTSLVRALNKEKKDDNDENCVKPNSELKTKNINSVGTNRNEDQTVDVKKISAKVIPVNKEENQAPVTEHELIKTPSYLSNPVIPQFDAADVKVGDLGRNSIQEMKPLSRDLKSIRNSEDTRRHERVAEIT